VNLDRLLEGTSLAVPFGQSQFAFARGAQFESYLTRNECAILLSALRDDIGFDTTDSTVVDLRRLCAPNLDGRRQRAEYTKQAIRQISDRSPTAPNLVTGAVFEVPIAGVLAYLEADAVAARSAGNKAIYTGEIKSFPIVDGRIAKEKLGKAADQVAVYQLLLQSVVEEVGGDSAIVNSDALIITPFNLGFRPKVSTINVESRVRRAQEMLANTAPVDELAASVPGGVSFGAIADATATEAERVRRLDRLAQRVGTHWCSSCLPNCGSARYCRRRAHEADDPAVAGETVVRLMPGVRTMAQARDLSVGAAAPAGLEVVADSLLSARRLYERFRPVAPAPFSQVAAS